MAIWATERSPFWEGKADDGQGQHQDAASRRSRPQILRGDGRRRQIVHPAMRRLREMDPSGTLLLPDLLVGKICLQAGERTRERAFLHGVPFFSRTGLEG